MMQQDADFITADFLYMFRAHDARNMYRKSAVIKSASCCITSVFYLTLYYDARKHKIKTSLL